jgi:hypothetical protein
MTNVGTHIAAVTGIIVVELDRSDIQKKTILGTWKVILILFLSRS